MMKIKYLQDDLEFLSKVADIITFFELEIPTGDGNTDIKYKMEDTVLGTTIIK